MSFGFLIYPGVEELDFQGPWEMVARSHSGALCAWHAGAT